MPKPAINVVAEWNKLELFSDELRSMEYDMFVPKSRADMDAFEFLKRKASNRITNAARDFLREKGFSTTGRARRTGEPAQAVKVAAPEPVVAPKLQPKEEPKQESEEVKALRAQLAAMRKLVAK